MLSVLRSWDRCSCPGGSPPCPFEGLDSCLHDRSRALQRPSVIWARTPHGSTQETWGGSSQQASREGTKDGRNPVLPSHPVLGHVCHCVRTRAAQCHGRGVSEPPLRASSLEGQAGNQATGLVFTGDSQHQDSCWGLSTVKGRRPATPGQEATWPGGRSMALGADRLKL